MRNTGVRTLFSVVISQGGRFSEAAWDEALWEILFPLLQNVHQMAATSSKAEVRLAGVPVSPLTQAKLVVGGCLGRGAVGDPVPSAPERAPDGCHLLRG